MSIQLLFITAFSLSMDAFAVSITNGLCYEDIPTGKNALYSGVFFGIFQGIMPLIGYTIGSIFSRQVESIDHWIALILLGIIGVKMIYDAVQERRNPEVCATVHSFKTLLIQALATSIDALAIGVGFAVININILAASSLIAVTTFVFSVTGVFIGKYFGRMLKDKAQIIGGIILVLIGINIFYEHMFV